MAISLLPAISQQPGCGSFKLYDVSSGWGDTGNPNTTDVTNAWIELTSPTITTALIFTIPVADIPDLFDPSIGITINSTDFNSAWTTFPDGVYFFKYVVVVFYGFPGQYIQYEYVSTQVFKCSIKCCIMKATANQPIPPQMCEDFSKYLFAKDLYYSLDDAACCGNVDFLVKALAYLTDYCANCVSSSTSQTVSAGCGCSGN